MNPLHTQTLDTEAETLLRTHGIIIMDTEYPMFMIDSNVGRPVIEVKTACEGYLPMMGDHFRCSLCYELDGLVSSFWTVGEVLSIYDTDNRGPVSDCIVVAPSGVFVTPRRDDLYQIDIPGDPADLIGKYAFIGCKQV